MFEPKKLNPKLKPKRVLAIASGKGGVGKSSITVNLALALQNLGLKVGIIDTDIYGPSIRKMLPEDSFPVQNGEVIIPAICQGIRMISMAYFRKEQEAAIVRAPIANGIISQFIHNVDWGDLDYLLIDFPPGTGDIQLTLSQQANLDAAILVTTPQEVSLLDVRKAIHLFDQVKVPILGILENMSYYYHQKTEEFVYLFGKGGGERLAQEFSVPLLGSIPIHPDICRCGDEGKSIFEGSPEISKFFLELARNVMNHFERLKKTSFPIFFQKDASSLTVRWSDQHSHDFQLSELQKNCPCANCVDEITGKRLVNEKKNPSHVESNSIIPIGRYGLRILFNSGCTTGIFNYDYLLQLAGEAYV